MGEQVRQYNKGFSHSTAQRPVQAALVVLIESYVSQRICHDT
jgi:hypothetical protein